MAYVSWSVLDISMILMLVSSLVWGAWRGLVYEILAIANWLFALTATSLLAPLIAQWVPALGGSGLVSVVVRYVAVFVVFVFVVIVVVVFVVVVVVVLFSSSSSLSSS